MVRLLHLISTLAVIALGVVHTALTPVLIGRFSMGAVYFASAGLALILLGFLNLALRKDKGGNRVLRILCYAANLSMTIFAAFAVMVILEGQAFFGLLMIIVQALSALALTTGSEADERT